MGLNAFSHKSVVGVALSGASLVSFNHASKKAPLLKATVDILTGAGWVFSQITKAMKMVAASKLRMDQRRLENGMPFALPVQVPYGLPRSDIAKGIDLLEFLASFRALQLYLRSRILQRTVGRIPAPEEKTDLTILALTSGEHSAIIPLSGV